MGDAQTFFTEVTEEVGISNFASRSAAFGDYDNDGWLDIFVSETPRAVYGSQMALWHNEGDGRFANYTRAIKGEVSRRVKGGGAIFGDYDRDGDLDLFVPVGAWESGQHDLNMLLRNDQGVFRNAAREAGLIEDLSTDNAIWLDYDRDGDLDLYTGNLNTKDRGTRNSFYRNHGDGTFTDVTEEVGLDVQLQDCCGGSNGGMSAGDFNDDGWPDLYVGAWRDRNRLFLNNGQGSFLDGTTDEIDDEGQAHGIAVGDIDNDGDLDIFQATGGGQEELLRSILLLNLGEGRFLDVTEGVGLSGLFTLNVSGAGLGDIDNDGDLDLLTADPHTLYLNNGDGMFADHTSHSGIAHTGTVLGFGDYDLDGFLDVLFGTGPNFGWEEQFPFGRLYHNNGNDNHWLRVELVGMESNRNGIGARVIAISGDLRQMREIFGGLGYQQDEMIAHFGLGTHPQVDRLEIRWPSGQVDVLNDVPADQKIRVFEGSETFHTVEPTRWEITPPDTMVLNSTVNLELAVRPARFEPEATITKVTADLSPFGGAEATPLEDMGDGMYRLHDMLLAALIIVPATPSIPCQGV